MRTRRALRAAVAALCTVSAACNSDLPTTPDISARASVVSVASLTTAPVLYDQSQTNSGIASFNSGASVLAADDFTVPAGETWTVSQVVVSGRLRMGFTTLPISIRANANGQPGSTVLASFDIAPTGSAQNPCCGTGATSITDYLFELPTPVTLGAGTYWLVSEGTSSTGAVRFEYHAVVSTQTGAAVQRSVDSGSSWAAGLLEGTNLGFALYGPIPTQQPQSITFDAITPNPAIVGGSASLSAKATSGLPVTFAALSPASVCTVSGGTVTFVGPGTCTVAADQGGDAAWLPAERVTRSVAVDYKFVGFSEPVDNDVLNRAKAGQAIPLKWRLLDANGAPVTTLSSVNITVASFPCGLESIVDAVEEYAASGSGLQNLGDGYYQLNWKTSTGFARTCKTLQLDLGEGSGARTARFQFVK